MTYDYGFWSIGGTIGLFLIKPIHSKCEKDKALDGGKPPIYDW